MSSAIFAFLHHACAFVIFGALFCELMLLKDELTPGIARTLARVDALYGIAAGILVVVGLIRVYYTEKGSAYYLHSATFIAKIVLFSLVGVVSIRPTRQFTAWRRALKVQGVPVMDSKLRDTLRRFIHIELALMLVLILCAALMARGIGYLGNTT